MSDELLADAARRAQQYLSNVHDRRVSPDACVLARLGQLGGPLPEHPSADMEVLRLLDEIGSPATIASAGGRYFGLVIGGALPITVAANWLATAWDQNAAMRQTSPVAALLEDITLEWLARLFSLPHDVGGAFVTGASMASFTALAAARGALLARAKWDVRSRGMFGAPPLRVVVSGEVHVVVLKALALLGFGSDNMIRVPVDGQGRMRVDALPELDDRTIICIQAGNVNTGSFDPAETICSQAKAAGAWVHVDGAFGMWAACAPHRAYLTAGMAFADSWATDAHKWLNTPYDCGIVLVRDPENLRQAMAATAAYLNASEEREASHFGPELSRRARAVEVWAAIRSLGRNGVADLVERTCCHAAILSERLSDAGFAVLNDVVINQVLIAGENDEATDRLIAEIQEDGTCWCGGTTWQGRRAMRVSISSWATTDSDMELSFQAMARLGKAVGAIR